MTRRLCVAIMTGGLLLAACGADEIAEKAIEGASGGEIDVEIDDDGSFSASDGDGNNIDVDTGDGSLTIEDEGGDSYKTGGELPEGFPRDVVRFPLGFDVSQVQEQNVGGDVGWVVLGVVSDQMSPVAVELEVEYGEPDSKYQQGLAGTADHAIQLEWSDYEGYAMSWSLAPNNDGDVAVSLSVKGSDR